MTLSTRARSFSSPSLITDAGDPRGYTQIVFGQVNDLLCLPDRKSAETSKKLAPAFAILFIETLPDGI